MLPGSRTLENPNAYLILDGQQRLTSLYQAFYGVGEHRYYIDPAGLEKGKDLEDCFFYMRVDDSNADYGTTQQQAAKLVFPLGRVFSNGGFSGWMNQVLKERCRDVAENKIESVNAGSLFVRHEGHVRPVNAFRQAEEAMFDIKSQVERASGSGATICHRSRR